MEAKFFAKIRRGIRSNYFSILERQQDHIRLYFNRLREIIVWQLDQTSPLDSEVEADESYFGGKRKGNRGRGATGNALVFGFLKRGGKVYTKMFLDARAETLMPIINRMILPDSIVYTGTWTSCNALNISDFRHVRINHSTLFADRDNHTNGIEKFWIQAKRHMWKSVPQRC